MAVTGALNQLVAGLHSGVQAGTEYGETGLKNYSQRKMGEAEAELDEYLSYDPTVVGKDGKPPPQPNLRDLNSVWKEYRAAARLSGDPEAMQLADERWATQLKYGANRYIDFAISALENGDHEGVKRALEHGHGLLPNGMTAKVKTNDKGEVVIEGYDEATDEKVMEKPITKMDLVAMKATANDPAAALEFMMGQEKEAYGRRQARIDAERQANIDALDRAETLSDIQLNKAKSQHYASGAVDAEGTAAKGNLQLRMQQQLDDTVTQYLQGGFMAENPDLQRVALRNAHDIQRVAHALAQQHGGIPDLSEMAQLATQLVLGHVQGDPEASRVIGPILGRGIPVE